MGLVKAPHFPFMLRRASENAIAAEPVDVDAQTRKTNLFLTGRSLRQGETSSGT
jgi:hypothetical protein